MIPRCKGADDRAPPWPGLSAPHRCPSPSPPGTWRSSPCRSSWRWWSTPAGPHTIRGDQARGHSTYLSCVFSARSASVSHLSAISMKSDFCAELRAASANRMHSAAFLRICSKVSKCGSISFTSCSMTSDAPTLLSLPTGGAAARSFRPQVVTCLSPCPRRRLKHRNDYNENHHGNRNDNRGPEPSGHV
jgi:hypothetical protein